MLLLFELFKESSIYDVHTEEEGVVKKKKKKKITDGCRSLKEGEVGCKLLWVDISTNMFSMAHFLCLSLVVQSFVKAWKRYQSNEASILKPKIKDVKVLQSAQFYRKRSRWRSQNQQTLSFICQGHYKFTISTNKHMIKKLLLIDKLTVFHSS